MTATRVLLFTGKGGVGKTTTAGATALRCADDGLRTIVLSTDTAHSLADAFDVPLGPLPVEIVPNLYGQQLDAQDRLEDTWADIQSYLLDVFAWAGLDGVEAEELAVLPGLDEVFALADIREHAWSGRWDVVVVDCAPTAETLRLLSLPEVLSWYMERVFPTARNVNKVLSPVLGRVTKLPAANDDVFGALARFYERLAGVRELLTDAQRTSVRLVVNPERMVIAEAKRTYTYLSLFGYRVDAVVANRLLPDAVTDPWFDAWKEAQREHLAVIDEGFAPVPVLRVDLAPQELVGVERLRVFADALYGDEDPSGRLHEGATMTVERRGAAMVLRLALPGAAKDDLDLAQHDDELLVRVGPYRRAIVLPDSLRRRPVSGAKLVDGALEVRFGARAKATTVA
ncbi:MAG: arsenite/tail-anchored protein-transporting ATPase [Actinomycetota bacterium]|jgi:arsenite-transporting ATPase|nr:arsenite/tail-anchored protein-transporting ATPase [Actinomycetota bacterium]